MSDNKDSRQVLDELKKKKSDAEDDVDEIYVSLRKLRKNLTDKKSVGEFRGQNGLVQLLTLHRKFSAHVVSALTKKEERSKFNSQAKVENEILSLLANCCHFDSECKLIVAKSSQFLVSLGELLQLETLNIEIAGSSLRLLANLCENSKESAAAVVNSKPLVNSALRILGRKFKNQEAAKKIFNRHSIFRLFRSASACSPSLARILLHSDAAYRIAVLLNPADEADNFASESQSKKPKIDPPAEKVNVDAQAEFVLIYRTLIELAKSKDRNFDEQIVRAQIAQVLMQLVKSDVDGELKLISRKFLDECVQIYGDFRRETSKYGCIEFYTDILQSISFGDPLFRLETCLLLAKFCRDAFSRAKLRESDSLSILIDEFCRQVAAGSSIGAKKEFLSCFVGFLYDDEGISYILRKPKFVSTLLDLVDEYRLRRRCPAEHSTKMAADCLAIEGKDDQEQQQPIYRPDSPNYTKFRRSFADFLDDSRLCKDFTSNGSPAPSLGKSSWSACSSPGRSWSPTGSLGSGSGSPSWSLDSDIEEEEGRKAFLDSEWFRPINEPAPASAAKYAPPLCSCGWTPSTVDELNEEALVNSTILFLSWLTHKESLAAALLVDARPLDVFLTYVAEVCRPQPRVGRAVKRLAKNGNLMEKLLKFEFHTKIRKTLCRHKCRTPPICLHCRKMCRIGCDALSLFRYRGQVDSDHGFGILAHQMLTGDEESRLKAVLMVPYLIKTSGRRRRFLVEYSGLDTILSALLDERKSKEAIFDCLKFFISESRLKELWTFEVMRRFSSNELANTCQISSCIEEDSKVSFVSSDGAKSLTADRTILSEKSSVFAAMFNSQGGFLESTTKIVKVDSSSSLEALDMFLHLLQGCCKDKLELVDDYKLIFDVLTLCDLHFRSDLFDWIVDAAVPKILRHSNIQLFLFAALSKGNERLFRMCIIFVLLFYDEPLFEEFAALIENFTANGEFKETFKKLLKKFLIEFV